jgi:hypothetical protein
MKLKPDAVDGERAAGEPGPSDRALAFPDPLFASAALVVAGDDGRRWADVSGAVDVVRGLLAVYPFPTLMSPLSARFNATATISLPFAAFERSFQNCPCGSTTARLTASRLSAPIWARPSSATSHSATAR